MAKEDFDVSFDDDEESDVRSHLLEAQAYIAGRELPVIMVLAGASGSGKSSTFNHMRGWMNARAIRQNAYEKKMPTHDIAYRRFWRDIPAAGEIGVYLSSWYTAPWVGKAYRKLDKETFKDMLRDIRRFEKTLADNGYVILKYWLDIPKKQQEKYIRHLESDEELRWKIAEYDYDSLKYADELKDTADEIIKETDRDYAPWFCIDADTRAGRVCETLESFYGSIRKIGRKGMPYEPKELDAKAIIPGSRRGFLKTLDFSGDIGKSDYEKRLKSLRAELNALFMKADGAGRKVVLVFEGPDASGKGGVISRLSSSLNPRHYNIFPISAPTDEEKAHHYLWRFWNRLSEQKLLSVFDRSWYGRVLVERIEGFTPQKLWLRGYEEINRFEKQLAAAGDIVVKFLLYISRDEQLARFEAREDTAYKKWKITDEDWRNRDRWDEYDEAFEDMLEVTDTEHAPWVVVPSDNKKWARIEAMSRLAGILQKELE